MEHHGSTDHRGNFRIFDLNPTVYSPESLIILGTRMHVAEAQGTGLIPAGYAYFGQFVDHDITIPSDRRGSTDFPSPKLDLDSVYGSGFDDDRVAVDRHTGCLLLGRTDSADREFSNAGATSCDLPRDEDGLARIPDQRNDENLIVAQLHARWHQIHNRFVEESGLQNPNAAFDYARSKTTACYREVVIYDFLRQILIPGVWHYLFAKRPKTKAVGLLPVPVSNQQVQIPTEFWGAAFRFGHSMIRRRYQINKNLNLSLSDIMRMTGKRGLFGKNRLPQSHVVNWACFFKSPSGYGNLSESNFNLSLRIDQAVSLEIGAGSGKLATENLLRSNSLDLPCAQEIVSHLKKHHRKLAKDIGISPLSQEQLAGSFCIECSDSRKPILNSDPRLAGFKKRTPLWYYILSEANASPGDCLGPLGSLLVGETLRAIYLTSHSGGQDRVKATWFSRSGTPAGTGRPKNHLTMADLLYPVTGNFSDPPTA